MTSSMASSIGYAEQKLNQLVDLEEIFMTMKAVENLNSLLQQNKVQDKMLFRALEDYQNANQVTRLQYREDLFKSEFNRGIIKES